MRGLRLIAIALFLVLIGTPLSALAHDSQPYVKNTVVGGAAGALIGAGLSREGSRTDGAVKGGLIGAGTGLGYTLLTTGSRNSYRSSHPVFDRHPGWNGRGHHKHKHRHWD